VKILALLLALALAACRGHAPQGALGPEHPDLDAPRPSPSRRMVPPEAYIRTYLMLFGGLSPLELQAVLRGHKDDLFATWSDYLAALGLPDHRHDLPRASQTNAVMVATFEALGEALCARAAEHDLIGAPAERFVFDFALTPALPTAAEFAERFDVLHRTFLGYPADFAPAERVPRFYALYQAVVRRHLDGVPSRFPPLIAGWAAVCAGLIRHPEFQVY
jgi:hypothetical protein